MTFTAMTYNIRSGRSMAGELNIAYAAQVIDEVGPDLVNLNEVRSHSADVGPVNQAQQLGELLGMEWRFGRSIPFMGGGYGNAMLSRFEVLENEVVHISDVPEAERDRHFEHRSVCRTVLNVQGTPLTLLGSHFGLSAGERRNACECVLRLADQAEGPVILMGDFNAAPDSGELDGLFDRFTDCFGGAAHPYTYPACAPETRIDYIMVRGLTVLSAHEVRSLNSDHLPLVAHLRLGDAD